MAFRLMISQDLQNLPNARLYVWYIYDDRILLSCPAYIHIIFNRYMGLCFSRGLMPN